MQNEKFKGHQGFAGQLLHVDHRIGKIDLGIVYVDQGDDATQHTHRQQ